MKFTYNAKAVLSIATLALAFSTTNFAEANCVEQVHCNQCVEKSIDHYVQSYPYLGLVMNEVQYGPITIKDVRLNDHDRVAKVAPGETVQGKLKYKIDSKGLETLHLHHIIVGLKNVGAQDCIAHSFGVWDSKGKATFELKAPEEKGVYEVRFCYAEALSCHDARETWTQDNDQPSSHATMGVLIVE